MKVTLVTDKYAPHVGGVETHVEQLAAGVAAAGHQVAVLTCDHGGAGEVRAHEGVSVRRFDLVVPSEHFGVSVALWRELGALASGADLVHVHNYSSLSTLMAAVRSPGPLVVTPHYHGAGHSRVASALHLPYRAAGARLLARADAIICVSDGEADLLTGHFPSVAPKVRVISNGVDLAALRAAPRWPAPDGRRLVLSVGRLEPTKDHLAVCRAMALLADDFRWQVIGEGSTRPLLEAEIARLRLDRAARLLGARTTAEVRSWYRSADVFVTMSNQEAQSLVLLEALGAGAAVVASDIPAHRAVARQTGGAVRLVPAGASPSALAAAIRSAADTPVPAARVPTWADVVDETLGVYEAVVRARLAVAR